MKRQLVLCVNDTGLHPKNPVKKGKVYTLAFAFACPCGKGDRLVCIEESHWSSKKVSQACIACKKTLRSRGLVAYLASRFVPINDPDVKPEEIEKEAPARKKKQRQLDYL